MAADDSVASLYALYKPIWAAEEADRCMRWAAFLAELAGGGGDEEEGKIAKDNSASSSSTNPSALPLSPSRLAAGLEALDALIVSWRREDHDGDDEARREKLARLRALAQAGLPMVSERERERENFLMGAIFPYLLCFAFQPPLSLSLPLSLSGKKNSFQLSRSAARSGYPSSGSAARGSRESTRGSVPTRWRTPRRGSF